MLSFKDGQTVQPLYDYYVETDLDSIDDQPVDYSKKYADQDSDEVCGSVSGKKRHLSTPSESDLNKLDDELKVYCIEGTPLIISSASSLCDLREIGSLSQPSENETLKQPHGKKPCFQSLMYTNVVEETVEKENIEHSETENVPPKSKEKEEPIGEVAESLNFRNEENFSKASSPLMFSRSSSVCSLNSFEQQSIIDDRSTVSIFSTLASGIISPSEIPDSPGEAMSPFIHKNKQTEFIFPANDNEKSIDPLLASLKVNPSEQFEDNAFIPDDDIKVFDDEGDFSSISNLSALTYQTHSHVSFTILNSDEGFSKLGHKSTIKVTYSVTSVHTDDQTCDKQIFSDRTDDCSKSNKSCSSTFANYSNTESMEVNQLVEHEVPNNVISSSLSVIENEQKAVEISYPESVSSVEGKCNQNSFDESHDEKITFLLENESEEYSKENSDDEADALLEECIKIGMPTASPSDQNNSKPILIHPCQNEQTSVLKENNQRHESLSFENDASDDENDLMEHCIQLGMPQPASIELVEDQKPENSKSQRVGSSPNLQLSIASNKPDDSYLSHHIQIPVSNSIQQLNLTKPESLLEPEYSDEDDNLLNHCIQLGMPKMDDTKQCLSRNEDVYSQPTKRNRNQESSEHRNSLYSENDASEDENALLEQCISLGRPQNKYHKDTENKERVQSTTESAKSRRSEFLTLSANKSLDSSELRISPMYSKTLQNMTNISNSCGNTENNISVQQGLQFGASRHEIKSVPGRSATDYPKPPDFKELGYRDNIPDGTSDVDDDDDDDILNECIRAGMPSGKQQTNMPQMQNTTPNKNQHVKLQNENKLTSNYGSVSYLKKPTVPNPSLRQIYNAQYLQTQCISTAAIIDVDSMCVYRTEDTPILSPSASISDLSTLSFTEDKVCHENYLNNSRNSDCSSDSEDDELLLQCIRSGMPGAKRAVA